MSDDDDQEVIVKIEDETDPTRKAEGEQPPIKDPAVKDLSEQYKELQAEADQRAEREAAANRRAEEAERSARAAIQEAENARAQVRISNLDTINTALASANAEVEAAKRDIKLAGEAGDYEALAEAHERLSAAKALVLRYDEAKSDLEVKVPQKREQREYPERRREQHVDIVEAYIAGRSAPTTQWLRNHTDFITDPRKNAKLNAAHHDAISEGYAPDSPKYFDHVEKFLGIKQEQQPERKRTGSRPVASTATANGSAPSNSSNEVRLTPGEARSAVDGTHVWNYDDPSGQKRFKKGDPIGVQEYARRKRELQRQGAYDRSYEVQ